MGQTLVQTQPPERGYDDEYVRQRTVDPDMVRRDVGRAIADVIATHLPAAAIGLGLDSESVCEWLGEELIDELRRAGYAVAFTGRRGGTHR